jgi:hypothetical protein
LHNDKKLQIARIARIARIALDGEEAKEYSM